MHKPGLLVLLIFVALPEATSADDATVAKNDRDVPSASGTSKAATLPESTYDPLPQLSKPIEAIIYPDVYSNLRSQPLANINFQDASLLARVRQIRSLSFLTLAEGRRSRLFLGVNKEGMAGLHFGAFQHQGREHYPELVRMPYLKKTVSDVKEASPTSE